MHLWKKISLGVGGIPVVCIVVVMITIQLTPKPIAYITRAAFDGGSEGVAYGLHPEYERMRTQVDRKADRSYPSSYEQNNYHVYIPKDTSKTYPVILWIHGGAFVGGDKMDIHSYATALASQGYVVFTMNYALAPDKQYPTPLIQASEMAMEIKAQAEEMPIDLSNMFIGGDSAGAHIALQFTLTQTNENYRSFFDVEQIFEPTTMKGMISFCGVLDISMYDETDSGFSNFLYDQSAWAYFDKKSWKDAIVKNHADALSFVNEDFPPVYLTDGDHNSFLTQAKQAEQIFRQYNIDVTSLLWEEGEHPHEYQFHLDQEAGQKNFDMVLEFLKNHQT